jgi:hypothetical protein
LIVLAGSGCSTVGLPELPVMVHPAVGHVAVPLLDLDPAPVEEPAAHGRAVMGAELVRIGRHAALRIPVVVIAHVPVVRVALVAVLIRAGVAAPLHPAERHHVLHEAADLGWVKAEAELLAALIARGVHRADAVRLVAPRSALLVELAVVEHAAVASRTEEALALEVLHLLAPLVALLDDQLLLGLVFLVLLALLLGLVSLVLIALLLGLEVLGLEVLGLEVLAVLRVVESLPSLRPGTRCVAAPTGVVLLRIVGALAVALLVGGIWGLLGRHRERL